MKLGELPVGMQMKTMTFAGICTKCFQCVKAGLILWIFIKSSTQCENGNRMLMKPGVFTGFPALPFRRQVQAKVIEPLDINGSSRFSVLSDNKSSTVQ